MLKLLLILPLLSVMANTPPESDGVNRVVWRQLTAKAKRQTATSPADKSFTGLYKITPEHDPNSERTLLVRLTRKRDKVELVDVLHDETLMGEVKKDANGESVHFSFEKPTWTSPFVMVLRRNWASDRKLEAFVLMNGPSLELNVEALLSVWACNNHKNPTHTADSEAKIKELTEKHGCNGWHKLESND